VPSASAQPVSLAGPWRLQLDDNPRWAQPGIDDSGWPTILLPQRTPRPEPIYWLRRTVTAPAAGEPLEVTVGLVSESYNVYANGVQIGGTATSDPTTSGFSSRAHFPCHLN
jgi:hypothetical protein